MTSGPQSESVSALAIVGVMLVALQAPRQDAAGAASDRQDTTQAPATGRGGQRGGGRGELATVGPGNLIAGVWGAEPTPV